jgi:hypothetical protein
MDENAEKAKTPDQVGDLRERDAKPDDAKQVKGGSNANFPPGQFPSSNPAQAPGTSSGT